MDGHALGRDQSGPVVLSDLASQAWVVDVTVWDGPVDRDVLRRIGDPLLVCFGNHAALCPLDGQSLSGNHPILFEIVAGRSSDGEFIEKFRRYVGESSIQVRERPAHAAGTSGSLPVAADKTTERKGLEAEK